MKNKIIAIIGAVFFAAAVVVGYFTNFDNADIISISLAAFGLVSVVLNVVSKQKEKGVFTWKSILVIALAILGGGLVCFGGLNSSILETISGLVLALLAVFLSIIEINKNK